LEEDDALDSCLRLLSGMTDLLLCPTFPLEEEMRWIVASAPLRHDHLRRKNVFDLLPRHIDISPVPFHLPYA
jgi:hypothetical protein